MRDDLLATRRPRVHVHGRLRPMIPSGPGRWQDRLMKNYLPFLVVAAITSFILTAACGSNASTSDGGPAGSGGSSAGGGAGGSPAGRGGSAGGVGGGVAGGAGGGVAGSSGGVAAGGRGGAAGTGAGGAAGGSFSCGDVICGPTQVCVIQCCGGFPLCNPPRPDGGTCPTGTSACTSSTGTQGCTVPCTPPPRYCVDVLPSCGATLTCGCLPTGTCCSIISGRQSLCSCG
jgi:hypothetical protein